MWYLAERADSRLFVQFQRRGTRFTADAGLISGLLLRLVGGAPPEHLRLRVGAYALGYDKWWDLDEPRSATASEVRDAVERTLQDLEPLTAGEAFRDRLLVDEMGPSGLGPLEKGWATALVRELGPPDWAR
jgi:hypothetical protein